MIQDQLVAEGTGSESEGILTYQAASRNPLFAIPGHPGKEKLVEEVLKKKVTADTSQTVDVVEELVSLHTLQGSTSIFFPVLIQYLVKMTH